MGQTTFRLEKLLAPLDYISERHNILPPGRHLTVKNDRERVLFFLEGNIELEADGLKAVRIHEGDVVFVRGASPLTYRSLQPGREARLHALILWFRASSFQSFPRASVHTPELQFARALKQLLDGVRHFPAKEWGNHILFFRDILEVLEHADRGAPWKVSGLCFSILSDYTGGGLEDPHLQKKRAAGKRWVTAVHHARLYMQEHFRDPLNLPDLAWQVRLSPEHLSRLFKKATGETVFACLDRIRIHEGKRILAISDWSLSEVAAHCGYSSSNLFCRHFRRLTGQTALSYRAGMQEAESSSPGRFFSDKQK